ncbi:GlsB/YeaQ/YmgE family stress response membrane protein, partial [Streptomyces sp. SID8455]|nr:GlsB/YeaQ/YmgE family stress response membrane protein [Streptomyces sp. SID8455]
DGFFSLSTWIAAIVGSVIVLLVYRLVTGQRSR